MTYDEDEWYVLFSGRLPIKQVYLLLFTSSCMRTGVIFYFSSSIALSSDLKRGNFEID